MIEEIIARLRTEGVGGFRSDMDSARRSTEEAGKGAAEATGAKGFGGMAKQLAVAAGGAVAVKKGFGFLKDAADQAGQLSRSTAQITRTTGMDAKASSAWVSVAKQRGIESDTLNRSFVALSRQIQAGGDGSKKAVAGFEALGVTQKELGSLNTGEVLARVSDGFAKMTDPAQKAALAQQLFGKQGQTLLPILNSGSDALGAQMAAMEKAGLTIDESGVKKGLELAKTQREIKAQMAGVKQSIGQALLPVLLELAQKITPIVQGFSDLLRSSPALTTAVVALGVAFAGMMVVAKVIAVVKGFAGAMTVLNAVMAANPIGIVIIAIAALAAGFVLLYTKCEWFRNAVQAVWGWIKDNWPLLLGILLGPFGIAVGLIINNFNTIKNAVKAGIDAIAGFVTALPGRIAGAASSAFNGLKTGIKAAADFVWKQVNWIVDRIKEIPGKIGDIGSAIAGKIKGGLSSVASTLSFGLVGGATGLVRAAQTGLTAGGGGQVMVGERGPEILSIPSGSRVTPLPPPTLAASQLGGAGSRPIVTQVFLERRMIAEALGSFTADQQAAR